MRYLLEPDSEHLDPLHRIVKRYANARNACRYMVRALAASDFPAGPYRLIEWPEGAADEELVGLLYKSAEAPTGYRAVGYLYKRV